MTTMVINPERLAKELEERRTGILFSEPEDGADTVLSPQAEQFYLLALNALEQAERYMRLAHYHAMRRE